MAERKKRHRRGEPLPTSATIVVRGDLLDPDTLRGSAVENEEIYGFFGISVFAEVGGTTWEEISGTKLARADWLVLFTADSLNDAGLELWTKGLADRESDEKGKRVSERFNTRGRRIL